MEKYLDILKEAPLCRGIENKDLPNMLSCLNAAIKSVPKNGYIFRIGEKIKYVALVIDGCVHIQSSDYWGNLNILNVIRPGDIFGEAYAAGAKATMINDAVAAKDSVILFIDIQRVLTVCPSACGFHSLLISNLFSVLAEKNRNLASKLRHITRRTTKEKLLSYLYEQEQRAGKAEFEIPFNRQQLADFLAVDRSAMSNELSKMRDEGILEFRRNRFVLKNPE